jgi:hypothetical protein
VSNGKQNAFAKHNRIDGKAQATIIHLNVLLSSLFFAFCTQD